ncbi:PREDICTED: ATPase family AAA domain-containing protein 5-like [Priapulus caudatus]|uniref:ATPase family AAA domain-containing protein 5-like n=1 Tax=Priapulus caudatus TaxID=37621 RepID=A0ABM1FAY0_PRICU|nr:PREDICTED: ATPase family AAA domain-containing protein 5-like [Priapulus caudatus]
MIGVVMAKSNAVHEVTPSGIAKTRSIASFFQPLLHQAANSKQSHADHLLKSGNTANTGKRVYVTEEAVTTKASDVTSRHAGAKEMEATTLAVLGSRPARVRRCNRNVKKSTNNNNDVTVENKGSHDCNDQPKADERTALNGDAKDVRTQSTKQTTTSKSTDESCATKSIPGHPDDRNSNSGQSSEHDGSQSGSTPNASLVVHPDSSNSDSRAFASPSTVAGTVACTGSDTAYWLAQFSETVAKQESANDDSPDDRESGITSVDSGNDEDSCAHARFTHTGKTTSKTDEVRLEDATRNLFTGMSDTSCDDDNKMAVTTLKIKAASTNSESHLVVELKSVEETEKEEEGEDVLTISFENWLADQKEDAKTKIASTGSRQNEDIPDKVPTPLGDRAKRVNVKDDSDIVDTEPEAVTVAPQVSIARFFKPAAKFQKASGSLASNTIKVKADVHSQPQSPNKRPAGRTPRVLVPETSPPPAETPTLGKNGDKCKRKSNVFVDDIDLGIENMSGPGQVGVADVRRPTADASRGAACSNQAGGERSGRATDAADIAEKSLASGPAVKEKSSGSREREDELHAEEISAETGDSHHGHGFSSESSGPHHRGDPSQRVAGTAGEGRSDGDKAETCSEVIAPQPSLTVPKKCKQMTLAFAKGHMKLKSPVKVVEKAGESERVTEASADVHSDDSVVEFKIEARTVMSTPKQERARRGVTDKSYAKKRNETNEQLDSSISEFIVVSPVRASKPTRRSAKPVAKMQKSTTSSRQRREQAIYSSMLVRRTPGKLGSPFRLRLRRVSKTSPNGSQRSDDKLSLQMLAGKKRGTQLMKAKKLVKKAKKVKGKRPLTTLQARQNKSSTKSLGKDTGKHPKTKKVSMASEVQDPPRRSTRTCALLAREEIRHMTERTPSRSCREVSTPGSKQKERKLVLDDDEGASTPKRKRHGGKATRGSPRNSPKKGKKLAPIFAPSADVILVKKPLTAQELAARETRLKFLMSSVPDAVRKQQQAVKPLDMSTIPEYSPWPEVSHVQQADASWVWTLSEPEDVTLQTRSRDEWKLAPVTAPGDFHLVSSNSDQQTMSHKVFSNHPALSRSVVRLLLAEMGQQSPDFPVKRTFKQYYAKKQSYDKSLLEQEAPPATDVLPEPKMQCSGRETVAASTAKRTQKRKAKEGEELETEEAGGRRKRRRGSCTSEEVNAKVCQPESRVTRGKKRQRSGSVEIIEPDSCTVKLKNSEVIDISSDATHTSKLSSGTTDGKLGGDLWTDKYQPTCATELIGNSASVAKLKRWLQDWKQTMKRENEDLQRKKKNKSKQKGCKSKDESGDSDADFIVSDSRDSWRSEEEEDNDMCTTMLIEGASGIGKTAVVYALAEELGFKVFEVNASSRRTGKHILSQLQEATQSHHVSNQQSEGVSMSDMLKAALSDETTAKSQRPSKSAPNAFSAFFKAAAPAKAKTAVQKNSPRKGEKGMRKCEREIAYDDDKSISQTTNTQAASVKLSNNSLILFEEVDNVFEELDEGFWPAVNMFIATTKRPIIMTTNHPDVSLKLKITYEQLSFRVPTYTTTASHLQAMCLAEGVRTDHRDILSLVSFLTGDIRRCMLSLQFWVNSGAGTLPELPRFLPTLPTSLPTHPASLPVLPTSSTGLPTSLPELPRSHSQDYKQVCESSNPATATLCKDDKCEGTNSREIQQGVPASGTRPFDEGDALPGADEAPPGVRRGCLRSLCGIAAATAAPNDARGLSKLATLCAVVGVDVLQHVLVSRLLPLPASIVASRERLRLSDDGWRRLTPACRWRRITAFLDSSDESSDGLATAARRGGDAGSAREVPAGESGDRGEDERGGGGKGEHCAIRDERGEKPSPAEARRRRCVYEAVRSLSDLCDVRAFADTYAPVRERGDAPLDSLRPALHAADARRLYDGDCSTSDDMRLDLAASVKALSITRCSSRLGNLLKDSPDGDTVQCLTIPVHEMPAGGGVQLSSSYLVDERTSRMQREAVISVARLLPACVQGKYACIGADYMPALRAINRAEKKKQEESGKRRGRFLHYFSQISLHLKTSTLTSLTDAFT